MLPKVLNIGINDDLDFYQKREVKVLNTLALIILVGLGIGATNVFFLGKLYPAFSELIIACGAATVFLFNWKKFYETAAFVFVLVINAAIFYVTEYYPKEVDTYMYYFPVIFCIALLHNPNKSKFRSFIFFVIIFISFTAAEFIEWNIGKGEVFTQEQIKLLYYYNVFFCVFITMFLVYVFIQMLNKKYVELSKLIEASNNDKNIISNSLKEKEILLAEIQHRVKNNLAVIMALFNFQKDATNNEEIKQALTEAKNRVLSIAMVHHKLSRKDSFSKINIKEYLGELIAEILRSYPGYSNTKINNKIEPLELSITLAVPLGLIVNELINNSFKHAFDNSSTSPTISIQLLKEDKAAYLVISDNGKGFPDVAKVDSNSLGLTLVDSLANQIDGKVSYQNDKGAMVILQFPMN